METNKPKVILVTVGATTTAAIHTLNEQQPPYICFFVSGDSLPLINSTILPALNYSPVHHDWIKTPSHQSLLECYRVLAEELPRLLQKWEVNPEELGVEYTAGTKPMSVAAVLATIDSSSSYFYVGSKDSTGRDREGIGVVIDGKELSWFQSNPWEELAISARRTIALLFNHGRFTDAQERTVKLANVSPLEMRNVYLALAELIEGYALWDRFEYKNAYDKIQKALKSLRLFTANRNDPLRATLDEVEKQVEFLNQLNAKGIEAQRLDILDMLANASRRADVSKRFDDAAARLYSTLEALARNRLANQYQIRTGAVKPEQIPETKRAEFIQLYGDPTDPQKGLRLALEASYHLLLALGDPLGEAYLSHEKELTQVLNIRNQSRLAHGTDPVRIDTYSRLRGIVMAFAGVEESDLPRFPEMHL